MRLLYAVSLFLLATAYTAGSHDNTQPHEQIPWHTDHRLVLEQARKTLRPILVYVRYPNPPCAKMERETFGDPGVASLLNANFVCLRVDCLKDEIGLVQILNVQGYPTVILAGPDGRILDQLRGYQEPAALLKFLHAASTPENVSWRADYEVARKEAASKKFPLMLYFTFDECYHARRFEKTTLRDPEILAILNKRFICVKIDVQEHGPLAKEFGVKGCPRMVFIAPDGKQSSTLEGYQDVPTFSKHLRGFSAHKK